MAFSKKVNNSCLLILTGLIFSLHGDTPKKGFWDSIASFFNQLQHETSSNHHSSSKYTLTRKQLGNYIDLYFASLTHALGSNITSTDIYLIKQKAYMFIDSNTSIYTSVNGIRLYNKDIVDKILIDAMVDIIEKNSYDYAFSLTKNSSLAQRVASSIRVNARAFFEKNNFFEPEELKPFFGKSLRAVIEKAIKNFNVPIQQPISIYPSLNSHDDNASCCVPHTDSCPVCHTHFSSTTERIILRPCGHSMCKMCALHWFFPNDLPDPNRKCPICHKHINIEAVYDSVMS